MANRFDDDYDGFATTERVADVRSRQTAAVTELALAEPPWNRLSRSLDSLHVVEAEEEPNEVSSVHARRNELMYQLSKATKPEVRRSIEARLALEEKALAEKFRKETHEPAKKKAKKLLGKTDELLELLHNL